MPDLNTLLRAKILQKSGCVHVRTFAKKFGSFLSGYCIRIAAYLHRSVMHSRKMHRSVMHWRSMGKGAMHRSARDCRGMH